MVDDAAVAALAAPPQSQRKQSAAVPRPRTSSEPLKTSTSGPKQDKQLSSGAQKAVASNQGSRIGPYVLTKTLGVGSTGRVKLGTHVETGQRVAVKIVSRESLNASKTVPTTPSEKAAAANNRKIEREITIMKLVKHPNVLSLFDVYETETELFLVLEHVEGGELFDYLVKRGRLKEDEALGFFQQIIFGLEFCHRHLICHRDLKPENLLLDAKLNVKIADFGMASLQPSGKMLETSCGSPHYASPEIIRGVRYDGASADIWSCGVILYALLTGNLPFDDENIRRLLNKVKSGFYYMPEHISPEAVDLIRRMLVVDVTKRIDMNGIISHPWFVSRPPKNADTPLLTEAPENLAGMKIEPGPDGYDQDILSNLQLLGWSNEAELLQSLESDEPNMEKVFYHLLARRKFDYFENYDERDSEYDTMDGPRRRTDSCASIFVGDRTRSESQLNSETSSIATNRSSANELASGDSEGSDSDSSLPRRRAASNAVGLSPTSSSGSTGSGGAQRRTTMDTSRYKPSTAVRVNSPLVSSFNDMSIAVPERVSASASALTPPAAAAVAASDGGASVDATVSPTPQRPEDKLKKKLNIAIPKNEVTASSMGSPKFHRKNNKMESPYPSPVITSSPKRSWFANLFNFKPDVQMFESNVGREETLRAVEERLNKLAIGTIKIYAKRDNILKCKFEGHTGGEGPDALKAVKFRIEVTPKTLSETGGNSGSCTVSFIQSQGAFSSFQAMCDALRTDWNMEG